MILLVCVADLVSPVAAQSLVLSNGVHKFPALTNTSVTMTDGCELWLTATNAPLTSCVVNLNSREAWVFMPGIKPSAAVPYLGQVRVNGAAAAADVNVRVVQHGMGAVIIPHVAGLQPVQVFDGPHFTGASMLLSQYAAYAGSSLGVMSRAISSFKLKRGYMLTVAANTDGTGASQCYVAQDADLEVSILPGTLDNQVSFIRIFPWRWTSKKGVAGNIWQNLNLQWYYNWSLNQNSSRDVEYVAIRQNQWWPSLNENWKTRGINHLLGFNEPDHAEQANMTVAQAINTWPTLLATGLRVGAPAVTDGGANWLYSFMDQADAAGLRVDFVPVHYYRCYDPANPTGAATQFYNYLKGIYDRVKRPIWVTEWNNGANWTGCADPTFPQQQAAVAKMIEMLDNTPFVERYAIFNWVEDVRRVQWDDGSLTSAGVTYRDKQSPVSHIQALPDNGTRSIAQFPFDDDTLDSSGHGNNAVAFGSPAYTAGYRGQAVDLDGTNNLLQLPANIARGATFTFAAWVNWDGGGNWQRIFDFGNDTTHYLCLTPRSGTGTLRFIIRNGGAEQIMETAALPIGQWRHVAVTLSGSTGRLYINGAQVASSSTFSIAPSAFAPRNNYLGKSQFADDPLFNGRLDDVLIADSALVPAQIAGLLSNVPPQFSSELISRPIALPESPYSGSISGTATDPDAGDAVTYSKASGPAWLAVAGNGILSGTPLEGDIGSNTFTVRVTDKAGASAFAVLAITVADTINSGTWIADADGLWSTAAHWSAGTIANGASSIGGFSGINITSDRVVTVDVARKIGGMRFGDTAGNQSWTLQSTGSGVLTLMSENRPSLHVTNTATISAFLAGTNGLQKSGPGTLVLSGINSLSGTLDIDSANASGSEGAVRVARTAAVGNISTIRIRSNNSGSSALQLDGSAGGVSIPARVTVNCRNVLTPTIQNMAGTNAISGFVGLESGGSYLNIQSDAGLLMFPGVHQYIGSPVGPRLYNFTGAGDHLLTGQLRNATNGSTVSLVKGGPGNLTVSGLCTHSGTTTVSGGSLYVNGTLTASPVTVSGVMGGAGTLGSLLAVQPGGILCAGRAESIGKLTVNGNVTLHPGSRTRFRVNRSARTNDVLHTLSTLGLGGTLEVVNQGEGLQAGDTFQIFHAAAVTGSFEAMQLASLDPGLAWSTEFLTNGVLTVIRAALGPPNLTFGRSGTNFVLGWPSSLAGWELQVQTNGLGTNWLPIPGSSTVIEWSFPIDAASQGTFFRLVPR